MVTLSRPRAGTSSMPPVRAVERALGILRCLRDDDLRLVDLAARLRLHKATVTRLLASLARDGLVTRDGRDRYTLGPAVLQLAARQLQRHRTVVELLRDTLERLAAATGETITVHVRAGAERLCVEEIESRQAVAFRAGIGHRAPLHVGAASKALLAFLAPGEIDEALGGAKLGALTDRTITSRARLDAELARVRRTGYAISAGERVIGAAAVSVPVLDADRRVVAAISVLGPDSRLGARTLAEHGALLRREVRPLPVPVAERSRWTG